MNAVVKLNPQPVKRLLPTADNLAPMLACGALHSRLLAAVPRTVVETMTRDDIPKLKAYLDTADDMAKPIEDVEMVLHLQRLFQHYPAFDMSDEAQATRWEDWIEVMGDIPADVLIAACRIWLESAERFAPSPGQLLSKVGGSNHWGKTRDIYRRRAADVLALLEARG